VLRRNLAANRRDGSISTDHQCRRHVRCSSDRYQIAAREKCRRRPTPTFCGAKKKRTALSTSLTNRPAAGSGGVRLVKKRHAGPRTLFSSDTAYSRIFELSRSRKSYEIGAYPCSDLPSKNCGASHCTSSASVG